MAKIQVKNYQKKNYPIENYPLNIDFAELKTQKTALLNIRKEVLSAEQYEALEGVINLIDAIQDYAVDVLGYDKNEVFNLTQE